MKKNILELTTDEFFSSLKKRAIPKYRGTQVLHWVFQKGVYDFLQMKNLPKTVQKSLDDEFCVDLGKIVHQQESKEDGSVKLLIQFGDHQMAETVYIPRGKRRTVCVSSQVGCKFGCVFCASGQAGFGRNLKSSEVISQILHARDVSDAKRISHIVFMGMGEPFDNYDALMDSIRKINSKDGLGIGSRKITVSTSGLVPKIEKFAESSGQVELSISLHGANDEVRSKLMPVNRKWPVKELIKTCWAYTKRSKRIITFEYLLAEGLNASLQDARELIRLLKGLDCKVNLIPLNPIPEFPYKRPSYKDITAFQSVLVKSGIKATVRFSRGNDINAACGQLRRMQMGQS